MHTVNTNVCYETFTDKASDLDFGTIGGPRRRWEDNIRMDLQEVGCGGMEWIGLA
jgi:hypothetical protein